MRCKPPCRHHRALLLLPLLFLLLSLSGKAGAQEPPGEEFTQEDVTQEVQLALQYGRCADALNLLVDKERDEDTLSAHHRYLMAEAFSCMGSHSTALGILSDLLKHDAENPRYLHRRALLYAQQQRWKKALADCRQLRRLTPSETAYCKACGEVALQAGRYGDALTLLRCHLQAHPHDVDAQHLVALAHLRTKELHRALLTINECIGAAPHEGEHRLLRAQVYEQQGVLPFAADDYAAYLRQHPANHKVWLQYGLLLQKLERKSDACRAFEQSKASGNLDAGKLLYRFCR